ncbi:hypothetical protein [Paraburkholderia translucens]|uniref:hypothetical protein n=1 Tax=Paraburkholderia translucens TaxID=2886945 RepID=UPI003CE479D6
MHFKILLTTHSTAFMRSGGGESELVQVAGLFNDSGVRADIYGIRSRPPRSYNAVMHFSDRADGEAIIRETVSQGEKLFPWPNVWWLNAPAAAEIGRIETLVKSAERLLYTTSPARIRPAEHRQCIQDTTEPNSNGQAFAGRTAVPRSPARYVHPRDLCGDATARADGATGAWVWVRELKDADGVRGGVRFARRAGHE